MTGSRVPAAPRRTAVAALPLVLALAGCAGATGSPGATTTPNRTAPAGNVVRVGLMEWSIPTSASYVHPGKVTLVVTNTGGTQHDLVVQGRKGRWSTPVLEPGDKARLVVHAVKSETLRLWCGEPGHRLQGMHTTLTALPR